MKVSVKTLFTQVNRRKRHQPPCVPPKRAKQPTLETEWNSLSGLVPVCLPASVTEKSADTAQETVQPEVGIGRGWIRGG